MSPHIIFSIAYNEYRRVARSPVVLVVGAILLFLAFIHAIGDHDNLVAISLYHQCDGLLIGFRQLWYVTNFICCIMAAFLGMMAVSEDRFKGTFSVLLSKPAYRRDVMLGKFFGLTGFMVLFLVIVMAANFLMLYFYYGAPLSFVDTVIRVSAYVFVLSLDMALVLGLGMLIGLIFSNILVAVSVMVTYLSFEWFWNQGTGYLSILLGGFPITPYIMVGKILSGINSPGSNIDLFNTSLPFTDWFTTVFPDIVIMVLAVSSIVMLSCHIFTRTDDI